MTEGNTAIIVDSVFKDFKLPHQRKSTIKSVFTSFHKKDSIKKSYEIQRALKDISFEVKEGEFFGIVGRNGSGKSTLLKMLAGIYQPTKGTVSVGGKLVPFIELGVGFNPELTGRENVYLNGALLGFSEKQVTGMYNDIVKFAELERFMDQKLKNYSSGMQVRLAFSMAIRADADILLVDEVLAVGDAAFQRKCFEYFKELKARKKTVVFVTHDMNSVREYCDRAMLIDDSELVLIGSPQDVAREYSLLFMENNLSGSSKGSHKRWGNGDVKIKNVDIKLSKDDVLVNVDAEVIKPVDRIIYGLHIVGQDGEEITAMNNRMIQIPDIENCKKGKSVSFNWKVLNVFNDGKYTITLTLVDDTANTLDWFVEAGEFSVRRSERSTTAVLPPVSVTTKIR